MRSTSSARRGLALLLCAALFFQGTGSGLASGDDAPEECILLKLAAPGIPADAAREILADLPALLEKRLRVRWIPPDRGRPAPEGGAYPEADAAALDGIAREIAAAARLMDGMDTREASDRLAAAERAARAYRLGERTRPLLAEILFRRGILHVWEGEGEKGVATFARSRGLRPGFSPDPALYSPTVRAAWEKAAERAVPPAEVLVQSVPSGARVDVDGRRAGTTPGRVEVPAGRTVRVRVTREGYLAEERTGQWLAGDSGLLEIALRRDPVADLADALGADPGGGEAGRFLGEMVSRSGAQRAAVVVVGLREGTAALRVMSLARGDRAASVLGEVAWPEGEGADAAASATATMLVSAGWPARKERAAAPWYRKWWIWALLGTAAAGIAAGASGGGGSGSSSGTIGVDF